jgi:hypothetical protein
MVLAHTITPFLHASLYELADESIMLGRDYACVDVVVLNLVRTTQREWIQVMLFSGLFAQHMCLVDGCW